jgi:hypothetical protein
MIRAGAHSIEVQERDDGTNYDLRCRLRDREGWEETVDGIGEGSALPQMACRQEGLQRLACEEYVEAEAQAQDCELAS